MYNIRALWVTFIAIWLVHIQTAAGIPSLLFTYFVVIISTNFDFKHCMEQKFSEMNNRRETQHIVCKG